jgi:hypothetical protein
MTAESIRGFLISEVRTFVTRVRAVPGVRRVALVGSLATAKADPKDADLLLWVDDGADLAPLAHVARQLKGNAQRRNSGADIFVVSESGAYGGRICHYRDCRPGIRGSCPARHCGHRPYLCDDLHVLKLTANIIAAPPLDLWPDVVVRAHIPDDIRELAAAMRSMESTCDSAACFQQRSHSRR